MNIIPAAENFEQIIYHQSVQELVPFLLALEKKDVVAVRERLKVLKKNLEVYIQAPDSQIGGLVIKGSNEQLSCLFLTGLVVFSRREAFSRLLDREWGISPSRIENTQRIQKHFLTIVSNRQPEWLLDWLLWKQETGGGWAMDYELLRNLEEQSIIPYSPVLTIRALPVALSKWQWELCKSSTLPINVVGIVADKLRNNASFLERDWKLIFAYESQVHDVWARIQPEMPPQEEIDRWDTSQLYPWQIWNQKHPPQIVTWQQLLLTLVTSNHLDRADILTRCLLALRRDFRRPLLTWFKDLFLSLKPTRAERLARQAELMELLAHPLPLVVNFAIEQVKDLLPEPGFTLAPLLLYTDNLLTRPDLKTGLRTLLAGLAKLPRQDAAHAPAVARLLAAALPHPDGAVQAQAAKGLAELLQAKQPLLSADEMAEIIAVVDGHAELLGSAARPVLAPWLAPTPAADHDTAPAATYAPSAQFVPDISPATAIAPVADWHELLFLTGQVLPQDNPLVLERWLDGLLRLRGQLPAGYQEQLAPYVKRLVHYLPSKSTVAEVLAHLAEWPPMWDRGLVESLFLSWYEGFVTSRVSQVALSRRPTGDIGQAAHSSAADPLSYVSQGRLAYVEELLTHNQRLPLLSTFTHQPHYVSPLMLVEKLLRYQQQQAHPNLADLTLALARTAFAAPGAATAARRLLPGLAHTGLRHLLDWYFTPGPAPAAAPFSELTQPLLAWPQTLDEALPGLWAVVARTKYPAATLPWLAALEQTALMALRAAAPSPAVATQPASTLRPFGQGFAQAEKVVSGLPLYTVHAALMPRHSGPEGWDGHGSLHMVYAQLYSMLPQCPAPLYYHTRRCAAIADNLEAANHRLITLALQTMLEPGPSLDEHGTALLASGLVHHTPPCRSLAQEVLLRAVAHGRLVPGPLGEVLGQQLAVGYVPAQRLAESLGQLRAIDAATDDALRQILEHLLPALPPSPPRNLRKLLDLYADLLARLGRPVPGAVQSQLREWGKTAALKKLADTLLA